MSNDTYTDFQPGPWWATVSGAGTSDAAVASWADDYTRHRTGIETTFSGVDSVIGRRESIQDVNP
jgi:hypothetical protein